MAQDENPIPVNGEDENKRRSSDLLPRYFRTTANKKFLSISINTRLNLPEEVIKLYKETSHFKGLIRL